MNGCCTTNAESATHGADCYWYWPCGCRKERDTSGQLIRPHNHVYDAEQTVAADRSSGFAKR
jgi:hypothetical protein